MATFKSSVFTVIMIALTGYLSGCITSVGPDYVMPSVDVQSKWMPSEDPLIISGEKEIGNWWTLFNDELLTSLIDQVSANNLDVRIAVARVNESRARLKVASSRRLPEIGSNGSVTRQRTSESLSDYSSDNPVTAYALGMDASWEVDLFGRVRRSVESATADFQASQEDRADMLITMRAEVASAYLNVRTAQARLKAANLNIISQQDSLELARVRFENGLATGLDVAQAERILASSEAEVPLIKTQMIQSINAIGILLGKSPAAFAEKLRRSKPIPKPEGDIIVGIPADLMRRRADIRGAERRLASQTAQVGVAKADLYPTLSLTGAFGLQSAGSSDFFDSDSREYSFGAPLSWTLFDGGRIRSQIAIEDAKTTQALLEYEKTVIDACREVEDAIAAYGDEIKRLGALTRAVSASRRTVQLSMDLYKDGLTDYQNVLDAQRSLFNAENNMLSSRGDSVVYLVTLYKALGGGWSPDDLQKTTATP